MTEARLTEISRNAARWQEARHVMRVDVPDLIATVRAQAKRIAELEAELARPRGDEPAAQLGKRPPRDPDSWTSTEPNKALCAAVARLGD